MNPGGDLATISAFFAGVAYSMRFELVFGVALVIMYVLGHTVGLRRIPRGFLPRDSRLPPHRQKWAGGAGAGAGEASSAALPRLQRSVAGAAMPRGSLLAAQRATSPEKRRSTMAVRESIGPDLTAVADRLFSGDAATNSRRLCDPVYVVPHVTQLCRSNAQRALEVHRAAMKAGLKLAQVNPTDCKQLFSGLIMASLRIGQAESALQLFRDLRQHGLSINPDLFSSATRLCTSKHLFAECLRLYDFVAEDSTFAHSDKSIWSCLLFCAIESKALQRCGLFFEQLKSCGTPSHKDYGNMIRFASIRGDWQLSLKLIREMRETGLDIDSVIYNTALATCVSADHVDDARSLLEEMHKTDGVTDVITYNTLLKGYAKAARMPQCFELYEVMRSRNIAPSQVTYGILLDGCINDNQLESAQEVFKCMTADGCQMNTVLYTTLIKGFARAGEVDQAMKVYNQMKADRGVPPDLITFSILIKANCDAGRLEASLQLLKEMLELGLRPDEVAFNNLLSGCVRPGNVELGKRLYKDMIATSIRPSNATFSIMIRLYAQRKLLDEAMDMLKHEPPKHEVEPEPRLYLQLINCCIRERQGRRALEVYRMMAGVCAPTVAAHASMLGTCVKLNMFETASELLRAAAEAGSRVDARDATTLLEAVLRKQKLQVAKECMASMELLGLEVEPRLLAKIGTSGESG